MSKLTNINLITADKTKSQLIIDDNKCWGHDLQFDRVSNYVDGDLHDFFDLVQDELLFQVISEKYDRIFIGEVFHVINLQTIIYNLEYASKILNENGLIQIAINENSLDTMKTDNRKVISRLEMLNEYQCINKSSYVDEDGECWTMLTLQVKSANKLNDECFETTLKIGEQICQFANTGKNISKIKAGQLKTACNLQTEQFKQAFTTIEDVLQIYLQSEILELEPRLTSEYLIALADFIFINRKALNGLSKLDTLKQGSFNIAFEKYAKSSLSINQEQVAIYANLIETIWNRCLKQKLDSKHLEQINNLN